jgi:YgiT-type zinc finger domain-containing protein
METWIQGKKLKSCLICRETRIAPGFTTIFLERDNIKLSIDSIPANICSSCGEAYIEEKVAARLLKIAENSFTMGLTGESLMFSMFGN